VSHLTKESDQGWNGSSSQKLADRNAVKEVATFPILGEPILERAAKPGGEEARAAMLL